jgi:hypothetical protein
MKKLIFFICLTGMLAPFQVFSVDLNRSVMKLLTSLSRQYLEQEEEVFFKQSPRSASICRQQPSGKAA